MSDWSVSPHPEIPELNPTYKPTRAFAPILEQLDEATVAQLKALMNMGIGEPEKP